MLDLSKIQDFKNRKIMVFGDVMLDEYLIGDVERISPEAPVPVVKLKEINFVPGGAGNVATNIKSLGGEVCLIGLIGDDEGSINFTNSLNQLGVSSDLIVTSRDRPTIKKTRIIAHQQQICRYDRELTNNLTQNEFDLLWEKITKVIDEVDLIVISDYAKGVVSDEICARLITKAKKHGLRIIVDPKGKNYRKYFGATVLTPNEKEFRDAFSFHQDRGVEIIEKKDLLRFLNIKGMLITRGEKGMLLVTSEYEYQLDTQARNVYDVTGAGDTVISTLGLSIASQFSYKEATGIANVAAGLVVEKSGTSRVDLKALINKLET